MWDYRLNPYGDVQLKNRGVVGPALVTLTRAEIATLYAITTAPNDGGWKPLDKTATDALVSGVARSILDRDVD